MTDIKFQSSPCARAGSNMYAASITKTDVRVSILSLRARREQLETTRGGLGLVFGFQSSPCARAGSNSPFGLRAAVLKWFQSSPCARAGSNEAADAMQDRQVPVSILSLRARREQQPDEVRSRLWEGVSILSLRARREQLRRRHTDGEGYKFQSSPCARAGSNMSPRPCRSVRLPVSILSLRARREQP